MKRIALICLLPVLILIFTVSPVFGASQMEISGVYEMKTAPAMFSQSWDNAYGVKVRLATRGDWKNNVGLTFCFCQYSGKTTTSYLLGDGSFGSSKINDLSAYSLGVSYKSSFGAREDLFIPYVKGEFGAAQMSTTSKADHTSGYLGLGLGVTLNVKTNFNLFLESGFVMGLNSGVHDKMIPLHLGITIHR